jgi:outer membrane immunogenic protein
LQRQADFDPRAGFYLGCNVGYSWGRPSTTSSFPDAASGAPLNSIGSTFNIDGVIGGGHAGYNWQNNNWVFGLEVDIRGSAEKGSTSNTCPGAAPTALATLAAVSSACSLGHFGDTAVGNVVALPVTSSLSEKIDWSGTVRGRIGPTIFPTIRAVTGSTGERISTDRTALGDQLTARFDAQSYGGRIEGGYRLATAFGGVSPHAVAQFQSFHTPGYAARLTGLSSAHPSRFLLSLGKS